MKSAFKRVEMIFVPHIDNGDIFHYTGGRFFFNNLSCQTKAPICPNIEDIHTDFPRSNKSSRTRYRSDCTEK